MPKKIITQIKDKIVKRKDNSKKNKIDKLEENREKFFNSDDYIIMATLFHNKNKDNNYRVNKNNFIGFDMIIIH